MGLEERNSDALMVAARNSSFEVDKYLKIKDAEVDIEDFIGMTVYDIYRENNNLSGTFLYCPD